MKFQKSNFKLSSCCFGQYLLGSQESPLTEVQPDPKPTMVKNPISPY